MTTRPDDDEPGLQGKFRTRWTAEEAALGKDTPAANMNHILDLAVGEAVRRVKAASGMINIDSFRGEVRHLLAEAPLPETADQEQRASLVDAGWTVFSGATSLLLFSADATVHSLRTAVTTSLYNRGLANFMPFGEYGKETRRRVKCLTGCNVTMPVKGKVLQREW